MWPHTDDKQRKQLGLDLGLQPLQVKFWFQNKRTQMKVINLTRFYKRTIENLDYIYKISKKYRYIIVSDFLSFTCYDYQFNLIFYRHILSVPKMHVLKWKMISFVLKTLSAKKFFPGLAVSRVMMLKQQLMFHLMTIN